MKADDENPGISRREVLKLSAMALGGIAAGPVAATAVTCDDPQTCYPVTYPSTQRYSYLKGLPTYKPWDPLDPDRTLDEGEMRITFLGSMIPPVRRAQQEMSIFVEVGWDPQNKRPLDQFVFDCGSGSVANYGAMNIGYGRMDKIFLTHLHADHMSDLSHIYCFGPSGDRKTPLFVWGPGPSGVKSPKPPRRLYDDGTRAFCRNIREAMRWHTESFSFQPTSYVHYTPITRKDWGLPCDPVPVGDDQPDDAYALIPIELDWTKEGKAPGDNVAYYNEHTGVKITHFPVIHCRKGSIGYKLEWNGLSMIFTGDTKPETRCIEQAKNNGDGIDVFIHEMIVPPEVWAMKMLRLGKPPQYPGPDVWKKTVDDLTRVQNSSHTSQGAFGYILSQIDPRPRLTVATHFPVADDTVACALHSVREHVPDIAWSRDYDPVHKNIVWSFDLMVIKVTKDNIVQLRALVPDYGWSPMPRYTDDTTTPKYWTWEVDENGDLILDENGNPIPVGDPFAQIDTSTEIKAGDDTFCKDGY